jgi:hypothetical protein
LELMVMSDSHSGSNSIRSVHSPDHAIQPDVGRARSAGHVADSAIDVALRMVPLPDGLLTRLAMIAQTIPDDAPDRVDWLGC